MRIAFIAQPFDNMQPPVQAGSLALWIYYMAGRCRERGHETVIFGNHGHTFRSTLATEKGIDYIFTPTGLDRLFNRADKINRKLSGRFRSSRQSLPFMTSWHHRGYAVEAAKKSRQLECDVVHIMNYSQFVPVIRRLHPKATIVLHMQCEWLTQEHPSFVKPRLSQADMIVGCSEYITRTIQAAFPEFGEKCVTVPNAADVPSANGGENRTPTVLFVGRLSPEKGVHDLIRAFRLVLQRFPNACLRLVGPPGSAALEFLVGISTDPHVQALRAYYPAEQTEPGDPYLSALKREAGEELGKRIIFEGAVKHDRIDQCYREASVLVNPSLSESFGISLVEAMMRKIPVVATRIGGMSYTVDHEVTGLLVNPANPSELAAAICKVLENPALASSFGEEGHKKALDTFTWEKTADLLLSQLQRHRRSLNA